MAERSQDIHTMSRRRLPAAMKLSGNLIAIMRSKLIPMRIKDDAWRPNVLKNMKIRQPMSPAIHPTLICQAIYISASWGRSLASQLWPGWQQICQSLSSVVDATPMPRAPSCYQQQEGGSWQRGQRQQIGFPHWNVAPVGSQLERWAPWYSQVLPLLEVYLCLAAEEKRNGYYFGYQTNTKKNHKLIKG